jgi:hypothetical protein
MNIISGYLYHEGNNIIRLLILYQGFAFFMKFKFAGINIYWNLQVLYNTFHDCY